MTPHAAKGVVRSLTHDPARKADAALVLADEVDRLEAQLAYTTAEYREQLEAVHALTEQVAEMQVQMAGFERMQAVLDACLPALEQQMTPLSREAGS